MMIYVTPDDMPLTVSEQLEKAFQDAEKGVKYEIIRVLDGRHRVVPGYVSNSLYQLGMKYFGQVKVYGSEGQRGWTIKRVGKDIVKYSYTIIPYLEAVIEVRKANMQGDPDPPEGWEKYYESVEDCLKKKGLWNEFITRIPPNTVRTLVKDVYNSYEKAGLGPETLDWCTAFSDIASDPNVLNLNQAKEILEKEFHIPFEKELPEESFIKQMEEKAACAPSPEECMALLEDIGYTIESPGEAIKHAKELGYVPKVKVVNEEELRKMGIKVNTATYRDEEEEKAYLERQAEGIGIKIDYGLADLIPGISVVSKMDEGEIKLAVVGRVPIASNIKAVVVQNTQITPGIAVVTFLTKKLGEGEWV